ncbi:MAG: CRISPR-associated endonuclease Cas2 [Methanobacterium sp.]|jgi:CRISPR-associated protein Cas2
MLILVIYDISDNHSRNGIIKKLRHFGLYRVQKSAFTGDLKSVERIELEKGLEEYLSGPKDSIYVVPICGECMKLTRIYSLKQRTLENNPNFQIL